MTSPHKWAIIEKVDVRIFLIHTNTSCVLTIILNFCLFCGLFPFLLSMKIEQDHAISWIVLHMLIVSFLKRVSSFHFYPPPFLEMWAYNACSIYNTFFVSLQDSLFMSFQRTHWNSSTFITYKSLDSSIATSIYVTKFSRKSVHYLVHHFLIIHIFTWFPTTVILLKYSKIFSFSSICKSSNCHHIVCNCTFLNLELSSPTWLSLELSRLLCMWLHSQYFWNWWRKCETVRKWNLKNDKLH